MRNRLVAGVLVVSIAVAAAGAPAIAAAIDDTHDSQRLVDLAQAGREAVVLAHSLADERDAMTEFVAAGRSSASGAGVSESQRARVDRQAGELRPDAPESLQRLLDNLPRLRQRALTGRGSALDVFQAYTETVQALQDLATLLARKMPERADTGSADALAALGRANEQASATRGLLLGALAGGGGQPALTRTAQRTEVSERSALADFKRLAPADARERFTSTVNGAEVSAAESFLTRLTDQPTLSAADQAMDADRIGADLSARIERMRGVESALATDELQRLEKLRDDDVTDLELRIGLVGICLLLALGAAISTARSMTRPLAALRIGAGRVAGDPITEEPVAFKGRDDEFAETVRHVNAIQEGARQEHERAAKLDADRARLVSERRRLAEERSELRRERDEVSARLDGLRARVHGSFVSLALRNLGLIERQLAVIEGLEEREHDPDRLETLFQLDHLATGMRRYSENLLVIAGSEHKASHPGPVSLLDVLRASISEVERYDRVQIHSLPPHSYVAGYAADSVSHLVAELLENATTFSPPEAHVQVSGWLLETGELMLSVQDEGIGMTPERFDELNNRLAEPVPDYCQGPNAEDPLGLGLYVVTRLAARHGVRVQLRPQQQGGVAAVVIIPTAILPAPPAGAVSAADTSDEEGLGAGGSSTGVLGEAAPGEGVLSESTTLPEAGTDGAPVTDGTAARGAADAPGRTLPSLPRRGGSRAPAKAEAGDGERAGTGTAAVSEADSGEGHTSATGATSGPPTAAESAPDAVPADETGPASGAEGIVAAAGSSEAYGVVEPASDADAAFGPGTGEPTASGADAGLGTDAASGAGVGSGVDTASGADAGFGTDAGSGPGARFGADPSRPGVDPLVAAAERSIRLAAISGDLHFNRHEPDAEPDPANGAEQGHPEHSEADAPPAYDLHADQPEDLDSAGDAFADIDIDPDGDADDVADLAALPGSEGDGGRPGSDGGAPAPGRAWAGMPPAAGGNSAPGARAGRGLGFTDPEPTPHGGIPVAGQAWTTPSAPGPDRTPIHQATDRATDRRGADDDWPVAEQPTETRPGADRRRGGEDDWPVADQPADPRETPGHRHTGAADALFNPPGRGTDRRRGGGDDWPVTGQPGAGLPAEERSAAAGRGTGRRRSAGDDWPTEQPGAGLPAEDRSPAAGRGAERRRGGGDDWPVTGRPGAGLSAEDRSAAARRGADRRRGAGDDWPTGQPGAGVPAEDRSAGISPGVNRRRGAGDDWPGAERSADAPGSRAHQEPGAGGGAAVTGAREARSRTAEPDTHGRAEEGNRTPPLPTRRRPARETDRSGAPRWERGGDTPPGGMPGSGIPHPDRGAAPGPTDGAPAPRLPEQGGAGRATPSGGAPERRLTDKGLPKRTPARDLPRRPASGSAPDRTERAPDRTERTPDRAPHPEDRTTHTARRTHRTPDHPSGGTDRSTATGRPTGHPGAPGHPDAAKRSGTAQHPGTTGQSGTTGHHGADDRAGTTGHPRTAGRPGIPGASGASPAAGASEAPLPHRVPGQSAPGGTPRLTDKGLPKRTPKNVARPAPAVRQRPSGVNAEELRRRLGCFQQGARDGRRDAEAEATGRHRILGETAPTGADAEATGRHRMGEQASQGRPVGPEPDAGRSGQVPDDRLRAYTGAQEDSGTVEEARD
ncbi:nitrate- and nitrite sensing domain-containing protein [Streptomyces palmae]|uniref:sensor histidine kinase n=1 Tax=Streptomyces palmae TaxID=1701085 RepID=UPI0035EEB634